MKLFDIITENQYENLLTTLTEGLESNLEYVPIYENEYTFANDFREVQVGEEAKSEFTTTFEGVKFTATYDEINGLSVISEEEELASQLASDLDFAA